MHHFRFENWRIGGLENSIFEVTIKLFILTVLFSIPINKLPCTHYVSADEADEDDLGGGSLLGDRPRASSAASTRSVPDLPANSKRKKTPLTGTLGRKARKLLKGSKQRPEQQPSEVGIRNVGGQIHSAYRGHQVCNLINPSAADSGPAVHVPGAGGSWDLSSNNFRR